MPKLEVFENENFPAPFDETIDEKIEEVTQLLKFHGIRQPIQHPDVESSFNYGRDKNGMFWLHDAHLVLGNVLDISVDKITFPDK